MSKFMYAVANEFTFNKQTIGRIVLRITNEGKLEMSHNGGDFAPLGPTAVEYMLGFGFQRLRNTYQTMTDASISERTAALDKAIAAVFDGTCGTGGGSSITNEVQAARDVAEKAIPGTKRADEWKAAKGKERTKLRDDFIAAMTGKEWFDAAVAKQVAVLEAEAKARAEAIAAIKEAADEADLEW